MRTGREEAVPILVVSTEDPLLIGTLPAHTHNSDKIIPYEDYPAFVNYCQYIHTQTHMQSVQELKGTSGCSHLHTYIVRFILYNFTFCCFYGILSILFHSFQIPLSDEESLFFIIQNKSQTTSCLFLYYFLEIVCNSALH